MAEWLRSGAAGESSPKRPGARESWLFDRRRAAMQLAAAAAAAAANNNRHPIVQEGQ